MFNVQYDESGFCEWSNYGDFDTIEKALDHIAQGMFINNLYNSSELSRWRIVKEIPISFDGPPKLKVDECL